eukprot:NODE_2356_length_620_cov_109.394046_g2002_i0.p3 GENE.NODE_2356_length_620_cov_109.394046_g2002_i0~~NODE_2356_length_620_cov_109.394046_g2002_i0.p3  ORF type:complete len:77 (+),score=5.57 NODE_2356_length_620_cov_109.394046_g2002_i0:244-474(+)
MSAGKVVPRPPADPSRPAARAILRSGRAHSFMSMRPQRREASKMESTGNFAGAVAAYRRAYRICPDLDEHRRSRSR